jgi:two-component system response regulator AtoC
MRVLIVDDDADLRQSLGLLLKEAGHAVSAEGEPARGLERAQAEPFDVVLCDVRMPGMDGLTFLRRYRESGGGALVVVMSAFGNEDAAIAAMREGAYDYLRKPFRADEVELTLRKAEERERLRREVETLRASLGADAVRDLVVAESRAMRNLLELASRVAAHATTVLITGESGTGKEVLARAIHRMSPRAEATFTAINCAAIPEQLLESELFGHMRGAFTGATADRAGIFEASHGGTLLLDEIGDLPLGLQAKLLRVLEEGEIRRLGARESRTVDVRVLAATAKPLERAVEQNEFRSDLFYRLDVVRLHLPPLRERREDVGALVTHFARQAAQRISRPVSLTPRALQMLTEHGWPGNVRELRNAVERAAVLSESGRLDISDFSFGAANGYAGAYPGAPANGNGHPNGNGHGGGNGNGGPAGQRDGAPALTGFELKPQVEQLERATILRALAATNGSRRDAAQLLRVSLRTLFYKLRRYQLD